jgi:hypothetical protein
MLNLCSLSTLSDLLVGSDTFPSVRLAGLGVLELFPDLNQMKVIVMGGDRPVRGSPFLPFGQLAGAAVATGTW